MTSAKLEKYWEQLKAEMEAGKRTYEDAITLYGWAKLSEEVEPRADLDYK